MAENDPQKPSDEQQETPKIHVDTDWKAQARAEKERLAREVEQQRPKAQQGAEGAGVATPGPGGAEAAAAGARGGAAEQAAQLPEASFTTLVQSTASQALMALGAIPDPVSGRRMLHMPLAKFHIDTLAVLEEKTRGNLTDEEAELLDQIIYETRMLYVQRAQTMGPASQAARQAQRQTQRPQGPQGPQGG